MNHTRDFVRYSDGLEHVTDDEDEVIASIVASMAKANAAVYNKHRHGLRGVHAKSHGILAGELRVAPRAGGQCGVRTAAGTGVRPRNAERHFGRVVFIVSNTFWSPPGEDLTAYIASKGALIGLTRTLAVALGGSGVAVTAVAPGLTRTPATADIPEQEFEATLARQALPRPLRPDDAAATVAFLVTDRAEALTGQTLAVDGGLVLR